MGKLCVGEVGEEIKHKDQVDAIKQICPKAASAMRANWVRNPVTATHKIVQVKTESR